MTLAALSPRERQVVLLICVECLGTKATAARLGISRRTVEQHRISIMRKLECDNLAALVRFVTTELSE